MLGFCLLRYCHRLHRPFQLDIQKAEAFVVGVGGPCELSLLTFLIIILVCMIELNSLLMLQLWACIVLLFLLLQLLLGPNHRVVRACRLEDRSRLSTAVLNRLVLDHRRANSLLVDICFEEIPLYWDILLNWLLLDPLDSVQLLSLAVRLR